MSWLQGVHDSCEDRSVNKSKGPPVVGYDGIVKMSGLSRARISQITKHPDFPPSTRLASGQIWWIKDVKKFFKDHPRFGTRRRGPTYTPAQKRQVEELYKSGMNMREISSLTGLSYGKVRGALGKWV